MEDIHTLLLAEMKGKVFLRAFCLLYPRSFVDSLFCKCLLFVAIYENQRGVFHLSETIVGYFWPIPFRYNVI